jgi:hypothetical protein
MRACYWRTLKDIPDSMTQLNPAATRKLTILKTACSAMTDSQSSAACSFSGFTSILKGEKLYSSVRTLCNSATSNPEASACFAKAAHETGDSTLLAVSNACGQGSSESVNSCFNATMQKLGPGP